MEKRTTQGKPERFMQPCILMALTQKPSYGYELIQNIGEYGFIQGDAPPGMVYRHLRAMEEEGLVVSEWKTESAGPAKRMYTITEDGREVLDAWIAFMKRHAERLQNFVALYEARGSMD